MKKFLLIKLGLILLIPSLAFATQYGDYQPDLRKCPLRIRNIITDTCCEIHGGQSWTLPDGLVACDNLPDDSVDGYLACVDSLDDICELDI